MLNVLKNFALPLSMLAGILAYCLYVECSLFDFARPWAGKVVAFVQPVLIFTMLFVSFCKVDMSALRLHRWQLWLLFVQALSFVLLASLLVAADGLGEWGMYVEGAMLCLICPTATAAAVVTRRLGGDESQVVSYTVLVNLLVSFLVPLVVPRLHPAAGVGFSSAAAAILSHVFPMLLLPLFAAWWVRGHVPRLIRLLQRVPGLAFHLWVVSLSLAIAVTARSIHHNGAGWRQLSFFAVISLVACVAQFAFGRYVGNRYGTPVSATQALGQKNTVFAIWLGYTFFTPLTSIVGGFYSVWHNLINSWQLYRENVRQTK